MLIGGSAMIDVWPPESWKSGRWRLTSANRRRWWGFVIINPIKYGYINNLQKRVPYIPVLFYIIISLAAFEVPGFGTSMSHKKVFVAWNRDACRCGSSDLHLGFGTVSCLSRCLAKRSMMKARRLEPSSNRESGEQNIDRALQLTAFWYILISLVLHIQREILGTLQRVPEQLFPKCPIQPLHNPIYRWYMLVYNVSGTLPRVSNFYLWHMDARYCNMPWCCRLGHIDLGNPAVHLWITLLLSVPLFRSCFGKQINWPSANKNIDTYILWWWRMYHTSILLCIFPSWLHGEIPSSPEDHGMHREQSRQSGDQRLGLCSLSWKTKKWFEKTRIEWCACEGV